MKIKYYILLTCFIVSQWSCAQDYFEGKVIFEKSYQTLNPRVTNEMLNEHYGNWMIGFVQENRYLMYAPLDSKDTTKIFYFLETSDGYVEKTNSDTIEHFRIDEAPGTLRKIELVNSTKLILGDKCKAVKIEYTPKEGYIEKVSGVYYFNPKYKLNSKYYINHKESFWNLFVEKSGSISVRNEITYFPFFKSVYEATNIIEQEIDDELFKLNPNKYINKVPR